MKYKWGAILGVWGSAAGSDVTHLNRCNKMRSQDVDGESSLFGRHSAESHSVCLSRDDQRSSAWWMSSIWAGAGRCPAPPLRITLVISSLQPFRSSDVRHYESDYVVVDTKGHPGAHPAVTSAVWSNETWRVLIIKRSDGRTGCAGSWLFFRAGRKQFHRITSRFAFVCFICIFVRPGSWGVAAEVNVSLRQATSGCGCAQMHWNTN